MQNYYFKYSKISIIVLRVDYNDQQYYIKSSRKETAVKAHDYPTLAKQVVEDSTFLIYVSHNSLSSMQKLMSRIECSHCFKS